MDGTADLVRFQSRQYSLDGRKKSVVPLLLYFLIVHVIYFTIFFDVMLFHMAF